MADALWERLAGSFLQVEHEALGGQQVPVGYVVDLYAPMLDRAHVTTSVNRVLVAFRSKATNDQVPDKDDILKGARQYRELRINTATGLTRTSIRRIFGTILTDQSARFTPLYMLDLQALAIVVVNWMLEPSSPIPQEPIYAQMVEDWLQVVAVAGIPMTVAD